MYEARAVFILQSHSKYLFDEAIELDGIRLESKDGKIYGEVIVQVEKVDPNLIVEKAFEKANEIALLLTLLFGESFIVEDVVPGSIVAVKKKEDAVKIEIYESIRLLIKASLSIEKRLSKEKLGRIKSELKELLGKLSKPERGGDILRAINWWRKGNLEEDGVDKFLDYYIDSIRNISLCNRL